MAALQLQSRTWATGEAWARYKVEITRLYQVKTLKEVMEYMECVHGFYATERMYKFRIKNWGLAKNWGDARVKRTLGGLESGTLSKGGTWLCRLERYLSRKPSALQHLPAPHKAVLQDLLRTGRRRPPLTPTPASGHRPIQPRIPAQMVLPDDIFGLFSAFLSSANGGSSAVPIHDVLEFVLGFRLANLLITDSHHAAGFSCLSFCFHQLSDILIPQPLTLLYVLNAALEVSTEVALPDILSLLFRYLYSLAEIRLGPRHPVTEIAKRFGALERDQYPVVLNLLRNLQLDLSCLWTDKEVAFSVYKETLEAWSASERRKTLVGSLQGGATRYYHDVVAGNENHGCLARSQGYWASFGAVGQGVSGCADGINGAKEDETVLGSFYYY